MKKSLATLVMASLALSTPSMVMAQDFGLGVGIAGNDSTVIRGDIGLDQGMRLEPYFGFASVNPDVGPTQSAFTLGTAFHLQNEISSNVKYYYGGFVDYKSVDTGFTSTSSFNLGPVAGAEYAFDEHFSLGAEVAVQLGFGDATVFGTTSTALIRYYFTPSQTSATPANSF